MRRTLKPFFGKRPRRRRVAHPHGRRRVGYQTGKRYNRKADYRLQAKPPGRRISRTGRRYYERRRNRSDRRGTRL